MALRLGDILVEKGLVTPQELELAVKEHQKTKEFLGQTLIRMGFVTEEKMLKVLAQQQGLGFLDLKETVIDPKAVKNVPAKFVWHYKVMPVSLNGNVLTVATSNPFDMWPVDDLETNLGYRVEIALALSSDIMDAVRRHYGVGADTIERILAETPQEERGTESSTTENIEDLAKGAEDASVIKLVNQILEQAIRDRATDIHFEHFRGDLALRYRVDGVLHDTQVSENIRHLYPAIISRVKVMAGLDIVERRVPQDGRHKVRIGKDEYELRVSIMPTLYGENVVIRILPGMMLLSLTDLGLEKDDLVILERLIQNPHGIIFVTGPTGSGKSTTLYACLHKLNTRDRKIITIEDPIEYEVRGISQIQVVSKIDLTFGRILRSVLRHDPDVIMLGEVRDGETARIAIQTALTGHLVFSTLHTNSAAGGVTRLLDMGVDPFLISSSVEAFIAQRLVRSICPDCREKISRDNFGSAAASFLKKPLDVYYRGKGCRACGNTGYRGRRGIFEILVMTESLKQLVLEKASSQTIEQKALEGGMRSLLHDGWAKVAAGITTPEEVQRVVQAEKL